MQIILNGQPIETHQTSLDGLLVEQGYANMNVATAMNDHFVPQTERSETRLHKDCVIEVVAPMQGG